MNHHPAARRAGLLVLGLLAVGDIATLAFTDGKTPPWAVAVLGAVLGALSLYLVVRALRNPAYPIRLLVGLRVLSAVTALPAFLVDEVPAAAVIGAAAIIVLTAVGVLLLGRGRVPVVTA